MVDFYTLAYSRDDSGVRTFSERLVESGSDSPGSSPLTNAAISAFEENSVEKFFTITLSSFSVAMTDNGATGGSGSKLLYTFPRGLTKVFGVRVALTLVAATGITATAPIVCGVGRTATGADNATLTSTEVTFLPSTACTLTGSTVTFTASNSAAIALLDGRTTAIPVYLNFAVDTTGISANSTLAVTGTIKLSYLVV